MTDSAASSSPDRPTTPEGMRRSEVDAEGTSGATASFPPSVQPPAAGGLPTLTPRVTPGPPPRAGEPAPAPLPSGAAVPGYELLDVLGRGGMGVVYKARQHKLNRLVALKMILHADHAGPAQRRRFAVEAEAIARLQHPNIVQIFEVGEQDGKPFFSLELCPGGSLDKKLAGKPLPPREAAALAETLARAMAAAHRAGVPFG